jgi:hypothetical protein
MQDRISQSRGNLLHRTAALGQLPALPQCKMGSRFIPNSGLVPLGFTVFTPVGDPAGGGFAESLARPVNAS